MQTHNNHFDFMRLVAVNLILFSHHFPLFGLPEPRVLIHDLGGVAFFSLMTMSGFLITKAWRSDPHLGRFLTRRVLRILPAFWLVVLLTVFVFGAALTHLSLRDYFLDSRTYAYLLNLVLWTNLSLPGVFETGLPSIWVNASIWSVPRQVFCYVVVAVLGVLGVFRRDFWAAVLFVVAAVLFFVFKNPDQSPQFLIHWGLELGFFFGVLWATLWDFLRLSFWRFAVVLLILAGILLYFFGLVSVVLLLLPVVLLLFCHASLPFLRDIGSSGDYSYGIYLWSYLWQQTLTVLVAPSLGFWGTLLLACLLTWACAAASWHLVEKRALSLKPKHRRKHHA